MGNREIHLQQILFRKWCKLLTKYHENRSSFVENITKKYFVLIPDTVYFATRECAR